MQPYPNKTRTNRRAFASSIAPPDFLTLEALPFDRDDKIALGEWLAESGWPIDRMSIATLEGYLVAMLAWPISLAPGAWLPAIWGVQGWKIPPKIADPKIFTRLIHLIAALMNDLDRQLDGTPPYVVPEAAVCAPSARPGRGEHLDSPWANGFMLALQQNSAGLKWRSPTARSAVSDVARIAYAGLEPKVNVQVARKTLSTAVFTLANERLSRGPLGALKVHRSLITHKRER